MNIYLGNATHRRGSFLVAVVAILSLLAVLTIVYVAIGRSDARVGASTQRVRDRGQPELVVRDYIAQIIADDLFEAVDPSEVPGLAIQQPMVRESWDYPSVAPTATFYAPGGGNRTFTRDVTVGGDNRNTAWFTPTGEVLVRTGTTTRRIGTGTDPWLASTEPTFLDFGSTSTIAQYTPDRRNDLGTISTLAPDGAFVNLFNLRADRAGFNATPWQMRADLNLYDASGNGNRALVTDYGAAVVPSDDPLTLPYQWGARQVDAHRPVGDPDLGFDELQYAPYQWADADGDGAFDARWFELIEARDPNGPWTEILSREGDTRYFIAATVRDLSASLNVNTATDDTLPPSHEKPVGMSPSHIDLRRMLSMHDFARDLQLQSLRFDTYDAIAYPDPGAGLTYDEDFAIEAGDNAYDALRLRLRTGQGSPATLNPAEGEFIFDRVPNPLYDGDGREGYYAGTGLIDPVAGGYWDASNTEYRAASLFALDSLDELLTFRGLNDPNRLSPLEAALFGRVDPAAPIVGALRSDAINQTADFFDAAANGGRSDKFIAHSLLDVRRRLTTLSGQRPIRSADLGAINDPNFSTDFIEEDLRTPLDNNLLEDADDLFKLYADALLPWSDYPGAWTEAELAPLAYAGVLRDAAGEPFGPELALRIAAHMAVNMADIADDDHTPTRRTLLIDSSLREDFLAIGGQLAGLPHRLLDLPDARLATDASVLSDTTGATGRAINVFGIEAQPFITMVGTMAVYTDVPQAFGGKSDEELEIPGTPPTGQPEAFFPNLDTTFDASNGDFLFEAIAVELTNPFNVPINLSGGPGDGEFAYYIQFGDLYFRLADHAIDNAAAAPVRTALQLDAGQSITVYCMSMHPIQVMERIKNASGGAVTADATVLQAWLDAQFGPDAKLMWPMGVVNGSTVDPDLALGTPLNPAQFATLTGGMLSILDVEDPTVNDLDSVKLWFAHRLTGAPVVPSVTEDAFTNDPNTDILVDRLRVPTADLLSDVRRDESPTPRDIAGASASPDNAGPHNEGLTIAQWAFARRHDDPEAARFDSVATDALRGSFPAWIIEPVDGFLSNIEGEDETVGTSDEFLIEDFTNSGNNDYADTSLEDWWNKTSGAAPSATIIPELAQTPAERSSELLPVNANGPPGTPIEDLRVEHRLWSSNSTIEVARLADLLLPMGIGPMQDPGADLELIDDDQWLTLSEAMAIAMGYSQTLATATVLDDLPSMYIGLGRDDPVGNRSALTRGQLFVDDFVPFYDTNSDGIYDPYALGGDDMPWGIRITPAMRILDLAVGFDRATASLARPLFGTLNINTAPLEVLRTLPMLSPPIGLDPLLGAGSLTPFGSTTGFWWWNSVASLTGDAVLHNENSDIAATLVGYRDRVRLFTRSPEGAAAGVPLDFLSSQATGLSGPPGYDRIDTGRGTAIGFTGTTERPGFRSIGELLALRDLNSSGLHDIDRLLFDGAGDHPLGVDSTRYGPNGTLDDGMDDDYDEQFALANGVFNTISVGSDFYAVWFLLHGYTEQDTQVDDDEPLVPSVARRFVMVVDRSNVIRRGERPKILLFREVPVALP